MDTALAGNIITVITIGTSAMTLLSSDTCRRRGAPRRISQDEFKQGCKKGWVQEASAGGTRAPTGKGSPEVPKE